MNQHNYTMNSSVNSHPNNHMNNNHMNNVRNPMGAIGNNSYQNNTQNKTFNNDKALFENSFGSGNIPIAALNANSANWKIKAKAETVSKVKEWNKGDKPMKKFSVIFADNKGGKIEGIFWNEAVARFKGEILEGKV